MSPDHQYSKLEENLDGSAPITRSKEHRPLRQRFGAIFASFMAGMLVMGLGLTVWDALHTIQTKPNRAFPEIIEGFNETTGVPLSWLNGDCGNSPEDANALGCQYSIVLHAWVPESCLTEEDHEDEKLMYEGKKWLYELSNGTVLSLDELRAGQFDHFTTSTEWHITHCMYVWKRAHRAMMDAQQEIDSYTASIHHTNHCVKMIGGDTEGMGDHTKVFAKYPMCA